MMEQIELRDMIDQLSDEDAKSLTTLVRLLKHTHGKPYSFFERILDFDIFGFDSERGLYQSKMTIRDELRNKMKILHGGALSTFVDTSMGAAIYQQFQGERAVTIDLHVQFLSPGITGDLFAETKIIKQGRRTLFVTTNVIDQNQQLIAVANGIFHRKSK
ncbi:uncharacterized domain 1-containing protein [Seinonella peptonophila]|uniref:Uncharacterized domain 1-containing protein n=1 Tax=Seinonella peptonophila TaxID=112248 RepID=A0A1M4VMV6_9BACL|nr:PaaI family thioesterase [Seinonella peptonophila]SHE70193.1 uncharacterized domain 1-containing protein [Seinonella peptonophila]